MRCPYCGKDIDDYSLTCPECGADLVKEEVNITNEKINKVEVEVVDKPSNVNGVKLKNQDANLGLGLSIAGMIINIMGLLSIAGLLFSIKAYRNSMELNGTGKGKSIAGIICACIQLAYMVYQILAFIFA